MPDKVKSDAEVRLAALEAAVARLTDIVDQLRAGARSHWNLDLPAPTASDAEHGER
jgi:hypothetical protein